MSSKSIGDNIKKILKEKGRNVSWLADELGIAKHGLYKTLKQEHFNTSTLQNIADVLGVNFLDLFSEPTISHTWNTNNLELVDNKRWPQDFEDGSHFSQTFLVEVGNPQYAVLFDAITRILQHDKSLSKDDILSILREAINKSQEQSPYVNVLQPKTHH